MKTHRPSLLDLLCRPADGRQLRRPSGPEVLEARIAPAALLGATSNNELIQFDSSSPDVITNTLPITGLQGGETIAGMDFRVPTGQLFALGSTNRLYTININTGVASQLGAPIDPAMLSGSDFGFDFNPTVDRIRAVSDSADNVRLNPNTGAIQSQDTDLSYVPGDPNAGQNPNVVGAAYTNADLDPATPTTLFAIDWQLNTLVRQGAVDGDPVDVVGGGSPNGGLLTTIGALGLDVTGTAGFDVLTQGALNTAVAALSTNGSSSALYTINLATGAATIVGNVGPAPTLVNALAAVPEATPPATLFAVDQNNMLLRFNSASPTAILGMDLISGLQVGEEIAGIDFRPTTGVLYLVGTQQLYTVDPISGIATAVAPLTAAPGDDNPFTGFSGTRFGVGFNPVPDLAGNPSLRVISDLDENVRINVSNGQVTTDTNISGDAGVMVGVAYTNIDLDPATGTTIFGQDYDDDQFVTSANPNGGAYTGVGDFGISVSDSMSGFDIQTLPGGVNQAFAALTTNFGADTDLYTIDLTTAAATLVGPIGDGTVLVKGLAASPAGSFAFSAPTYTLGESGPVATITINRLGGSDGLATVQFSTNDASALAGSDYTDSDQTLIFGPGFTSQTVTVPLNNDAVGEDPEFVNLTLSNPTGGALLGGQKTARLNLVDDDIQPANAFGVDSGGNLVRFNIATPGTIVSSVPIGGLQPGETVLGIDFRPATGQLFAAGSTGRLYTLDLVTAAATQTGTGTFGVPLNGIDFGFDFNPTVDRIRLVSDADQNLRLNPNDGSVVDFDTATPGIQSDLNLQYAAGDPNAGADPSVTASAYTNSANLATSTTLYGIDTALDILALQNPPNNGTLNTVGALGIDASAVLGFDIRAATGGAFATMVVGGAPGLYSINLANGAASLIGPVGAGLTLGGLAVAPEGFTATLSGNTATFAGSTASDAIGFDSAGGLLRHNRFSAGDAGFNSNFDFDATVAGDQTLSATNPAVSLVVDGGSADDRVTIGTVVTPASDIAAAFQVNGSGGGDTLTIEDSTTAAARTVAINGGTSAFTGLGGLITYGTLERVNLNLGAGADTVNILGTSVAAVSVNAGGGNDTVIFADGASLHGGLLDGGPGVNTLDYSAWTTAVNADFSAAQAQTLFLALLSGAQEPGPLSSSQGSGLGVFTLNPAQTALTFGISATGLVGATVTGNHFHNAAIGVNGAIVRGLIPPEQIDIIPPDEVLGGVWTSADPGGSALTPTLVAEMLANRIYFNTHSDLFPSGELRGQLISQGSAGLATGTGGARNFDNLTGGSAGDTLVGNENANQIVGNSGNDTLGGGSDGDNLTGGVGHDILRLNPLAGTTTIAGGNDNDTIDFSLSSLPVVFDLDLVGTSQAVASNNARVLVTDLLENFTGSGFNDVIKADAQPFARTINGGPHTTVPPGDRLKVDAQGETVSINRTDANTGTVSVAGYGVIAFDEVETLTLRNSPSTAGFEPGSGTQAFTSATIYPTGKQPRAVATGDVNGDGFDDIVTAVSGANKISVLLNAGNGTFLPALKFSSGGAQPVDIALGDFDGDSDLDIAVTNRLSNSLGILLGNGSGAFLLGTSLGTGLSPLAVETADLNGDNDVDLVVALRNSNLVSVFLGAAGSGFGAPQDFLSGGFAPRDLAIADFNNDTHLDVAVINSQSNNLGLLLGNGTGGLAAATLFSVGVRPTSVASGDFNNDGATDLMVTHGASPFVSFLAGNGAAAGAQFDPQLRIAYGVDRGPTSVLAADFNGDGNLDVALANSRLATLSILLGTGNGTFSQPFDFPVGAVPAPRPFALALSDFNHDGAVDLVAATVASNSVSVLLRNTTA